MSEWFTTAFGADYLELYPHRDREDAARAIAFITGTLSTRARASAASASAVICGCALSTRARASAASASAVICGCALSTRARASAPILDCACGAGRHLELLREAGLPAVGIDLSMELLGHGAANSGPQVFPAACGDMRVLPFADATFGAVLSLFTSFGYFEDGDDRRVLDEIVRVLRPGGLFVFDFLNAAAVRSGLVPRSERALPDGQGLIEERRIDESSNHVVKRVRRLWPDGRSREWTESVHLYDADTVEALFRLAGMSPIERFGDFDRIPYGPDSPRLIVVARKDQG